MQPASINLASDLLLAPSHDPTPIFDLARSTFATELLAAAVAHLNVFEALSHGAMSFDALRGQLGLADRAASVLVVALRAMGLIVPAPDGSGRLDLSPSAREHLVPGGPFYMGDYVGLSAQNPGVREMAQRLRTNRPAFDKSPDADAGGTAFIYREGTESAMDHEASARRLTLALAGRAKNVAPLLARNYPLPEARRLLDAGGGTGIYSLALLRANPRLRTVVWDRAEVLKVAREFTEHAGLTDRVDLVPGDMFADPLPGACDVILLSNILHDWDVPECRTLVGRCAAALPSGGRLLIHDVFLNDAMDGPLPVALYSASLFSITEGRAYSAGEYRAFLTEAGLRPEPVVPTGVHCGVLAGRKP
jgi:SAM-dependent methyltransferase